MRRRGPHDVLPWFRGLLAGAVLFSSIGSCELPKPKIPSIGVAPAAAPSVVAVAPRAGGGATW